MSDIKLCSQAECTGCFACKQVCPNGAIQFTNENGFLYPRIESTLCVECGLCTKVCPVLTVNQTEVRGDADQTTCYAIWNKSNEERIKSSSGGVFSALAKQVITEGGVVYGAAWDADMQLRHIGVENISYIDSLRRSKYVQSNTDGVYKEVKQNLITGRKVVFCGTPCQIGGLLSYLRNKDYHNLVTVGVICHGVPSQWSFDKYLHEIEEDKKIKVYDCNFRSKDWGWRTGLNLLVYGKTAKGNKLIVNKYSSENSYFNAFLKQYFLRESCYSCPFKGVDKNQADIMLSDFWGLWSVIPWGIVDYGKGVSAVVANSNKGRQLLSKCMESLVFIERPYSEYSSNSGLRNASKPYDNEQAFEYLKTNTWKDTQSKYFPLRLSEKLHVYARILLGENIFILIKKIISKITIR